MDSSRQRIILPGDSGDRIKRGGRLPIYCAGNIWTPHIERQVREFRAMRAIVERHRRRHKHGPPLCSTTFGGQTVPPLFGGGSGGFAQGDIRIGSVGATEVTLGSIAHTIPAATANIGDELWVVILASGTAPIETSGGWVVQPALAGNFRFHHRVADGTASDDFVMAANTLFVIAKMWSLQEVLAGVSFLSFLFQGGTQRVGAIDPWEVGNPPGTSMVNATGNDPDAFAYLFAARFDRLQPTIPTPTVQNVPITAMETITEEAHFRATGGLSIDTLWLVVNFRYTNPSIAYAAYDIGYLPNVGLTGQATTHQRFAIF